MGVIFQKFLSKADVASKLSVPSKCLKNLPGFEAHHDVYLPVKDGNGSVWKFRCSIRKRNHPKPILCGDWRRFAVSKGLSIGDEVKLFAEIEQAAGALLHYRVEVKKAINMRLFGVSFDHAPPIVL